MTAFKTTDAYRKWHRENWRRMNGWDESMITAPPEPRVKREEDYHRIVDLVYKEPGLNGAEIAFLLSLKNNHTVHNTLRTRHITLGKLKQEAVEFWRFD